jgi:hypothetical protein
MVDDVLRLDEARQIAGSIGGSALGEVQRQARVAPTLPLPWRVRAPARESAMGIKGRGRPTRSNGWRSTG